MKNYIMGSDGQKYEFWYEIMTAATWRLNGQTCNGI